MFRIPVDETQEFHANCAHLHLRAGASVVCPWSRYVPRCFVFAIAPLSTRGATRPAPLTSSRCFLGARVFFVRLIWKSTNKKLLADKQKHGVFRFCLSAIYPLMGGLCTNPSQIFQSFSSSFLFRNSQSCSSRS